METDGLTGQGNFLCRGRIKRSVAECAYLLSWGKPQEARGDRKPPNKGWTAGAALHQLAADSRDQAAHARRRRHVQPLRPQDAPRGSGGEHENSLLEAAASMRLTCRNRRTLAERSPHSPHLTLPPFLAAGYQTSPGPRLRVGTPDLRIQRLLPPPQILRSGSRRMPPPCCSCTRGGSGCRRAHFDECLGGWEGCCWKSGRRHSSL